MRLNCGRIERGIAPSPLHRAPTRLHLPCASSAGDGRPRGFGKRGQQKPTPTPTSTTTTQSNSTNKASQQPSASRSRDDSDASMVPAVSPSDSASGADQGRLSSQLERLRAQNEELAKLALDLAADRERAAERVRDLEKRFRGLASRDDDDGDEEEDEEEAPQPSSPSFSLDSEPPFDPLPWPPSKELLSQASEAIERNEKDSSPPRMLVVPAEGCRPGGDALVLYDASRGPLSDGSGGSPAPLKIRVGVNGWVDSVEASAERLDVRRPSSPGDERRRGEWWAIHVSFPRLLSSSKAIARRGESYDNNGGTDFEIPVAVSSCSPSTPTPTEGEGLAAAAAASALEAATRDALLAARDAALDSIEASEKPLVEEQAVRAAEEARRQHTTEAAEAQRAKARALAVERRAKVAPLALSAGKPSPPSPPVAAVEAALAVPGRWGWTSPPRAGQKKGTALLYNASSGPLLNALGNENDNRIVRLHLGVDGWWQPSKQSDASLFPSPSAVVVLPMRRVDTTQGSSDPLSAIALASGSGSDQRHRQQWWAAEDVPVDAWATRLDFVFSVADVSGLPTSSSSPCSSDDDEGIAKAPGLAWDNDSGRDFHTHVAASLEGEQLVDAVLKSLASSCSSSPSSSSAAEDAAASSAAEAARARAAASQARRRRTAETVFTLPYPPRAGEECTLFYDPSNSVLKSRTAAAGAGPGLLVAKGGWNRGRHPTCFAPTKLRPAVPGGSGVVSTWLRSEEKIRVPEDAWCLDAFVSDAAPAREGGYLSDDARGSRYHVAVAGGEERPPLKIAHVAVEAAPAAKVGGMADVVTALARAARDLGHDARIVMPKFDCLDYSSLRGLELDEPRGFWVGSVRVAVWQATLLGVPTTLLEPTDGSVWAGCIYGRNDDAARFGTFCAAASALLRQHSPFEGSSPPDVIHAHDWQSAPLCYSQSEIPSVFTIHNLEFGADLISRACAGAAVATTVSETYSREIAGHPAVAPHLSKLVGVRNGIDTAAWNPATDALLPIPYDAGNWREGKRAAKAALLERLGLDEGGDDVADVAVVGVVSRLTAQKGIGLIKHAAWRTVERGARFVLLGSAPDGRVQAEFDALARDLARAYPGRAGLRFAFDEPLSHLIYAGCDVIAVPSIFEPCGLSQIIAARCGSLPLVRRTGGLADTVHDADDGPGNSAAAARLPPNGYSFESADASGVDYALGRALDDFANNRAKFERLVENAMSIDWSWAEPCLEYEEVYWRAAGAASAR